MGTCDHGHYGCVPPLLTGTDSPIGPNSQPTDTVYYHAFYLCIYILALKEY